MNKPHVYEVPARVWALFALSALLLGVAYYDGLKELVHAWDTREEYSHGFLIPLIALFLAWQRKADLESVRFNGSVAGLIILVLGLGLLFLGDLSTLYVVVQYAFLIAFYGLVLSWIGWQGARILWAPLVILAFMIPLPAFLFNNLSAQLQLISSEIGVWVIRLFGISVYLEGNVIDLGTYKLQVVEACSGLRYLFPLMTLGFIVAYIYRAATWKKVFIFISTIPITVLMNSFRIGVIGVMVEYWGQSMAEGFLHDFEGWVVFMACLGVLLFEMWILSCVGRERKSLREVFEIDWPSQAAADVSRVRRKVPGTLIASVFLAATGVLLASSLQDRENIVPERAEFAAFPIQLGDWRGKVETLDPIYVDTLNFDDYFMADYAGPDGKTVNFYVAYYGSQSKGESAHSPRSCLPGGGWEIYSLDQRTIDGAKVDGKPISVNRVEIKKGNYTQLVYYWFQGRGRVITNEYMVKWYLFWDSLTKNRSDGALVRLTTLIAPGEDIKDAERRLVGFTDLATGVLGRYVPD